MTANNSRLYRVEHHTAYRYSKPVMLSHQLLHLTPRPLDYQQCHGHEIEIQPQPTVRRELVDRFGNPTTEIAIESAHTALDIRARSVLEVSGAHRIDPGDTPPWETIRDALAYRAGWRPEAAVLEATQFLFESPHVRVKRGLRDWAGDCFESGVPILAAAGALMAKIHDEFDYDPESTTITTPVMKVLEQKRGVCQDFTHFMISCLRSMGLAARYVSGYLLTSPAADQPPRVGADASHAWVALFIAGNGWVNLDPTNNILPSLEHMTLGWGRDFSDVTPLRGVINGGGEQTLDVEVAIEPVKEEGKRELRV